MREEGIVQAGAWGAGLKRLQQRLLPDRPFAACGRRALPRLGAWGCAAAPAGAGAWRGGEGRSRRGGPAVPGAGVGRASGTGVRGDRARFPRAAASKGTLGTHGARAGWVAPSRLVSGGGVVVSHCSGAAESVLGTGVGAQEGPYQCI